MRAVSLLRRELLGINELTANAAVVPRFIADCKKAGKKVLGGAKKQAPAKVQKVRGPPYSMNLLLMTTGRRIGKRASRRSPSASLI